MPRKCDCCGFKPDKTEVIMTSIIGPAYPGGIRTIRVCLVCWGEIMKEFGRMVRKEYVTDPFYEIALAIIAARKEAFVKR